MTLKKEAEHRDNEVYALWLKPENEVYDVLKRIIDNLAEEYDAPKFEPHITVADGIRLSKDHPSDQMAKAAEAGQGMTLYLRDTDFSDAFHRSLFIHIAPNDALLALRERSLREFKLEHDPYMPHISLMYKEMDATLKKQIIDQVGKRFDLVFIPDKLYLVRVSGPPEHWKEVMHVPLTI